MQGALSLLVNCNILLFSSTNL